MPACQDCKFYASVDEQKGECFSLGFEVRGKTDSKQAFSLEKMRKTSNNFYAFCSPKLNGLDKIAFKVLAHFLQTYLPTHHFHDTFQRKEYHGLHFLYLFFFVQICGEA